MPACGAELVATSPQHLILKPPKPVVIDGKLDEWEMARTSVHDHGQRQGPAERHPQQ